MARALFAVLAIPLFASLAFGSLAIIAAPLMLAASAVIGVPLLFLLRKLRRLDWWHGCAAGMAGAAGLGLAYWAISPDAHFMTVGVRNLVLMLGFGALLGLVAWVAGIFRNPAFPFVAARFPGSMWLVLPLAALGVWLFSRLETQLGEGRVVAVSAMPQGRRPGMVSLRLRDGEVVHAMLPVLNDTQPPLGHCYVFERRWALTQTHRVYFIIMPKLGEHYDEC